MGMKTNEENVNEGLIKQLKGSMNEGDYGVFVALSHFTDHAKKFIFKVFSSPMSCKNNKGGRAWKE